MASSIISYRIVRGTLLHVVGGVCFPHLRQALCAASAALALQDLQGQRSIALTTARGNAS